MRSLQKFRDKDAFTLVELLITIAIILIIAVAAIPIYGNLQVTSQLNESSSQIIQAIRIARERSVAGLNNSRHGVYLEINTDAADKYILYQGSTYASRQTDYDLEVTLDNPLTLSTTLTGSEVNFITGSGVASSTGIITLTHDTGGTRTISINSMGAVEED